MLKLVTAAIVCLVLARVAAADPTDPTPVESRDPGSALALSLGATAAAWTVFGSGVATGRESIVLTGALAVLVAPSAGEWYAGKPFTAGLGIRAASAAMIIAAEIKAVECDGGDSGCGAVGPLLVGGLIGLGAGTILDIAVAPRTARAFNDAHRRRMWVTPSVMSAPSGPVLGLGIGGAL